MPSPAITFAIPCAAASSETSPSSRRATTICRTPTRSNASASTAVMRVPFFKVKELCWITHSWGIDAGRRQTLGGGDLCHDRYCDLGWRHRANVQSDWRMDARERIVAFPRRLQTVEPLAVGFTGDERADIKTIALKCMQQREIIDFGIVRQSRNRGVSIDIHRRQHGFRPVCYDLHIRKTLGRRKRAARIDDAAVVAER